MTMTGATKEEKALSEQSACGAAIAASGGRTGAWRVPGALRGYLRLLGEFSIAGFKLRDQRSLLGFLWSFLNPLLMTGVLFVVFQGTLGQGVPRSQYFLFLLTGTIVWNFFVLATSTGAWSVTARAELMKNLAIRKELPVHGDIGAVTIQHACEIAALLVAVLALGRGLTPAVAALPLIVAAHVLLIAGIALTLACVCVVSRDVQHIWEVLTRALFFLTPVFYPVEFLPEHLRWIVDLNPVSRVMGHFREVLLEGRAPAPGALLLTCAIAAAVYVAGYATFKRFESTVIEKA